ncbi:DEAD/DEAH box helicase [Bowmanella pacifica]|uniref:ATP-dependent helicase n=1 Tax=Bowmanella pacifica TaxID=502051 RepID=A0A917YSM4_9ALTE|nr:DEAD/DEAH box helicase [Bowmanella pacifica]GGO65373.1 ATP-dependent helicase [Bowmanella pacifica]
MGIQNVYSPGMRIVVRDAEWVVRKSDPTADGGYLIECEGLSELVRGKEGRFLTAIENDKEYSNSAIEILDPALTKLTEDKSPNYKDSLLYIEAMLRQKVPTDEHIYFGHKAAMDTLPFQLDPTITALKQPRQRILIADAVGLGKTLEAGILMSELIRRGKGKRILVLAVKSMLTQFQKEMWSRFSIPLTRLDSSGLQQVRNRIPTNHNPFHFYDKSIISIDTLKQDVEYRHYLEQAYWDIIVIDEAHNVAKRGSNSQRSRLASLLSQRSDTLIMLSATPHDGKPESFASLMNMLDATAIANEKEYQHEDFSQKGLVVRRFKKDVKDQIAKDFPERDIQTVKTQASPVEEDVYRELTQLNLSALDKGKKASQLLRVTIEKTLFSSPIACLSTVQNRIVRLETKNDPEFQDDLKSLKSFAYALQRVTPEHFSKYQRLLTLISDPKTGFGWKPNKKDDRLVIFTESIPTLNFLYENLQRDLGLEPEQISFLKGQEMSDTELMQTVEEYGKEQSKLRILVCSDVASEGINLHYLSHKMIHFDIPWSLMVFQQRNGRIDRYGQTKQPLIRYLVTTSKNENVRGDSRTSEVLIEKDEQAQKNIGDPSEFTGRFDQESEEEAVAEVIAESFTSGEDILADIFGDFDDLEQKESSPLDAFLPDEVQVSKSTSQTRELFSLFSSDIHFAEQSLEFIKRKGQRIEFRKSDASTLSLTVNNELEERLKRLPDEIYPQGDQFILTNDIVQMSEEIAASRGQQHAWPRKNFLWQLHPVMEWLNDKVLSAFGRHHAPLVRVPHKMPSGRTAFVLNAIYPNRKSHPLINDWVVVHFNGNQFDNFELFEQFADLFGLKDNKLSNPATSDNTADAQALLRSAIDKASEYFQAIRNESEGQINLKLQKQVDALEALKFKRVKQLALNLDQAGGIQQIIEDKKQREQSRIEKLFDDYIQWIEDTVTTEKTPFIQLVAVFTGSEN